VFVEPHARRSSRPGNVQTCQRSNLLTSFTPKSLPLNLFADPHPLNPYATIFYKKGGGGGCFPSGPLFYLAFHLPYALPSSVSCNSFICHSYENTGGVGVFFPFWNPLTPPAPGSRCHCLLPPLPKDSGFSATRDFAPIVRRPRTSHHRIARQGEARVAQLAASRTWSLTGGSRNRSTPTASESSLKTLWAH
jgi:hypothetical protein